MLTYQPVANCYVIAYLKDDLQHKLIAFLAFIVQFALTYVLLMNVVHDDEDKKLFPRELKESSVLVPILTAFTILLVLKPLSSLLNIRRAYPDAKSLFYIDLFANGLLGLAIIVIQFMIIAKQDNRLDFVLNSIAAIFILELDDNCVFVDEDEITDLHRQKLMKLFRQKIDEIGKS